MLICAGADDGADDGDGDGDGYDSGDVDIIGADNGGGDDDGDDGHFIRVSAYHTLKEILINILH